MSTANSAGFEISSSKDYKINRSESTNIHGYLKYGLNRFFIEFLHKTIPYFHINETQ